MTDERPSDDEVNAMVAELVAAGLLTVGTDAEGYETWALTAMGAQVATQMAMSSETMHSRQEPRSGEAGPPSPGRGWMGIPSGPS